MSEVTEKIKERLGIVDVISSYLKLEKAGSSMKAKCPFHNEKTPSFSVSPLRGSYYCFGCGQKGDIFSFVQEFEGVDFPGALKILGERAGVPVVFEDKTVKDERTRLYQLLEKATQFYESQLKERSEIKKYLKGRGLTEKTIENWQIGYAPGPPTGGWYETGEKLEKADFTTSEIEKMGLIKKGEKGGFYDRFRNRIMFPISDSSGRIIAYSGRLFGEDDDRAAKYVNSPETTLFNKSKVLYGYDKAKFSIRKNNFSLVVEGQIDLVLSHQAGYTNTTAISGTALTLGQLTLLQRLSNNVVLAFDADKAGVASSGKGVDLALALGMDVKIAALPEGKDPADLIVSDASKWKAVIRDAKHVVDFYTDYLLELHKDPRKKRLEVGRIVIPYIAKIPNKIDQAHFVSSVARALGILEDPIWEEVQKIEVKRKVDSYNATEKVPEPQGTEARKKSIEKRIVGLLLWQEELKKPSLDIKSVTKELIRIIGEEAYKKLLEEVQNVRSELLFEIERLYDSLEGLEEDMNSLLLELEKEQLREAYNEALESLRQAESDGSKGPVEKALKACRAASEKLRSVEEKTEAVV